MIPFILTIIFLSISALHFYWAFGGTRSFENALPSDINGNPLFRPTKLQSVIVGFGLLLFGLYYLTQGQLTSHLNINLPGFIGWIVVFIFTLRAIGDFKYVGFFKKVRSTAFAKADTKYYSPLCLLIAILGLLHLLFG